MNYFSAGAITFRSIKPVGLFAFGVGLCFFDRRIPILKNIRSNWFRYGLRAGYTLIPS